MAVPVCTYMTSEVHFQRWILLTCPLPSRCPSIIPPYQSCTANYCLHQPHVSTLRHKCLWCWRQPTTPRLASRRPKRRAMWRPTTLLMTQPQTRSPLAAPMGACAQTPINMSFGISEFHKSRVVNCHTLCIPLGNAKVMAIRCRAQEIYNEFRCLFFNQSCSWAKLLHADFIPLE